MIFRGHAAQNLAAFRNIALNWHRFVETVNIAATRNFTRQSQRRFTKLGIVNWAMVLAGAVDVMRRIAAAW